MLCYYYYYNKIPQNYYSTWKRGTHRHTSSTFPAFVAQRGILLKERSNRLTSYCKCSLHINYPAP